MKLLEIMDMMDIKEHQQKWLVSFFDQTTGLGATVTSKAAVSVNEQLAEELHKPVTKKFKRRKVYVRIKDNIWAADSAEMESWSSKNKNVTYLLCVIDAFTKYA